METKVLRSDYHVFAIPNTVDSELIDALSYKLDPTQVEHILGYKGRPDYNFYCMLKSKQLNTDRVMDYICDKYDVGFPPTESEYIDSCREDVEDLLAMEEQKDPFHDYWEDVWIVEVEAAYDEYVNTCREYYQDVLAGIITDEEYIADCREWYEDSLQEDILAEKAVVRKQQLHQKRLQLITQLEEIDSDINTWLESEFA